MSCTNFVNKNMMHLQSCMRGKLFQVVSYIWLKRVFWGEIPPWNPERERVDSSIFYLPGSMGRAWNCCVCTSGWQLLELRERNFPIQLFWLLTSPGRHGEPKKTTQSIQQFVFTIIKFSYPLCTVCPFRPHVNGPRRAEQASLWLHGKAQEKEYDFETIEQVLQIRLWTANSCYNIALRLYTWSFLVG